MAKIVLEKDQKLIVFAKKEEKPLCPICKKKFKTDENIYTCEICHKVYHQSCYLEVLAPVMKLSKNICFHRIDGEQMLLCKIRLK